MLRLSAQISCISSHATFKAQSCGHYALQRPHRKGSKDGVRNFWRIGRICELHLNIIRSLYKMTKLVNKMGVRCEVLLFFMNNCQLAPSQRYTFSSGGPRRPRCGECHVPTRSTRGLAPAGAADVVHGFHANSFG